MSNKANSINVTSVEFNRLYGLFEAVGDFDDVLFNYGLRSPLLKYRWREIKRAYDGVLAYYDGKTEPGAPKYEKKRRAEVV